jgi:hypothetical protein
MMTPDEQRTLLWKQARAGCATGSRFGDIIKKPRSGNTELAARRDYRLQLMSERLTGAPYDNFKAKEVEWGVENEPLARLAYEKTYGILVEEVGFQPHEEIEWCGVSPDGLVGEDGMIEIKCPYNPGVHLNTILMGSAALAKALLNLEIAGNEEPIPPEHIPQVQGNLWVLKREWCDFISFDPRYPEHLQLYVYRVHRDEAYIKNLEVEVRKFLAEVEDAVGRLISPEELAVIHKEAA